MAAHFVETFVNVPGLKAVFAEKAFHRHDATYILGTKATQTFLTLKLTLAILEKVAFASALAAASRFVGAFGVADSANGEFSSLDVLADFLALDTEVGD